MKVTHTVTAGEGTATLTLTTDLKGHAYLCSVPAQQVVLLMDIALSAAVALAREDPRGYKE